MVKQNGNKRHITIYSATPSNPANRTLESIYHTFNFHFSVRPEVKLDVHPSGLDHICEHPRATKLTQQLTEWCVSPSLQILMLYPQQSLTLVVLLRIHGLMMASNAWVKRSATGARQVSPNPAWHQQKPPRSLSTSRNYTFACWSIYHVFPPICHLPNPLQSTLRKAVKNKSKFSLTLLCKRTVTSQRKFGGQNRVPREIGTRAQTVKESEPKW